MGRRIYRSAMSTRRVRRRSGFDMAAADAAWDARKAYQAWADEIEGESESLGDLLASEYGIDPTDLEETELFESFMDAMEAEAWQAAGRRRLAN